MRDARIAGRCTRKPCCRIEQARAEGARLLDLGDLPLDELPEELGSLTKLRVLALGMTSIRCGDDGIKWRPRLYPDQDSNSLT